MFFQGRFQVTFCIGSVSGPGGVVFNKTGKSGRKLARDKNSCFSTIYILTKFTLQLCVSNFLQSEKTPNWKKQCSQLQHCSHTNKTPCWSLATLDFSQIVH